MAEVPKTEIDDGVFYLNHPDHRNDNFRKSQWIIEPSDECDVFREVWSKAWHNDILGWGLYRPNGNLAYLGRGRDGAEVVVAKFDSDQNATLWHGYPVDHRLKADRPPARILGLWLDQEIIPAAKIRKIQKGVVCKP